MDTILAHPCILFNTTYIFWVVAIRQSSSSGKPKSPRIQVVLPEDLCARLSELAEQESRTVSNMAKVLIQQGLRRYDNAHNSPQPQVVNPSLTDRFRSALEAQPSRRLRGAPRRLRLHRP